MSVAGQLQPVKDAVEGHAQDHHVVTELFERIQAPLLHKVSSFIIFFTRASWAATVALSTIALFLITCRIECVTPFAQAFRRSDQTTRCALHKTSRVAG